MGLGVLRLLCLTASMLPRERERFLRSVEFDVVVTTAETLGLRLGADLKVTAFARGKDDEAGVIEATGWVDCASHLYHISRKFTRRVSIRRQVKVLDRLVAVDDNRLFEVYCTTSMLDATQAFDIALCV